MSTPLTPPPPTLSSPAPAILGPPQPQTPQTSSNNVSTSPAAAAVSSAQVSEPSPPVIITVPGCSAWFAFEKIHTTEQRCLPEFFDGKSKVRTPKTYQYYRNYIIRLFRSNASRKITFTEARRGLVGDVGSVRRVFDFLESWGLINYTPPPARKEKKEQAVEEAAVAAEGKDVPKRVCSSCKSVISMVCFVTDKADIVLCARCFVRSGYRPGLSNNDFRRVEISEESKTEWTDKETLHLLEAVFQYGEDWKRVAEHVGNRSEKDCVARFIKLPFGEQFLGPLEPSYDVKDSKISNLDTEEEAAEDHMVKRRRLTPLADASNPIMAQVAFLSAMVGHEVAEAAARASVAALHKVELSNHMEIGSNDDEKDKETYREAVRDAKLQLEEERQDTEKCISDIIDIEMKEIQEKIINFEDLEYQLEKERVQLTHIQDLLSTEKLVLPKNEAALMVPHSGNAVKVENWNGIT